MTEDTGPKPLVAEAAVALGGVVKRFGSTLG